MFNIPLAVYLFAASVFCGCGETGGRAEPGSSALGVWVRLLHHTQSHRPLGFCIFVLLKTDFLP